MRELILSYADDNFDDINAVGSRFLIRKGVDTKHWLNTMSKSTQKPDELALHIAAKVLNIHVGVIGANGYVWTTQERKDLDSCSVVFMYCGCLNFVKTELTGKARRRLPREQRDPKVDLATHPMSTNLKHPLWSVLHPDMLPHSQTLPASTMPGKKKPSAAAGSAATAVGKKQRSVVNEGIPGIPSLPKPKYSTAPSDRAKQTFVTISEGKPATRSNTETAHGSDAETDLDATEFEPISGFRVIDEHLPATRSNTQERMAPSPDFDPLVTSTPVKQRPKPEFQVSEFGIKRKSHRARKFRCDVCQQHFTTVRKLTEHIGEEHHMLFSCVTCGTTFKTKGGCQKHSKGHSDSTHACEQCDYTAVYHSDLVTHMKTHSQTRPYQCPNRTCTSAFKSKGEYNRHMQTHSGLVFSCEECDYTAHSQHVLNDHVKTKHVGVPCPQCDMVFDHRQKLKNHRRQAKH
jgi:hypothetical protein